MLEYLLLRHKNIELFLEAPLKFIVLDEIHTHTGSRGSEIACLIRRVRGITGKTRDEVICIGTSATLKSADSVESVTKDGEWEKELKRFAANIFGVPENKLYLVQESYKKRKEKKKVHLDLLHLMICKNFFIKFWKVCVECSCKMK